MHSNMEIGSALASQNPNFPGKKMRRWIKVEVNEPVTITTKEFFAWTSSYTSYQVRIETNHWAFSLPYSEVRRRYSEFIWLRSKLQNHHPNNCSCSFSFERVVPPLPGKRYLHGTRFDSSHIEERRAGLSKFLQRVMRSNVFLSDAALHLFLQSSLTIEEIEAKLSTEECHSVATMPYYGNITAAGLQGHDDDKNGDLLRITRPPSFLCRSCSSTSTSSADHGLGSQNFSKKSTSNSSESELDDAVDVDFDF